jgi:glycosyltransferase involved in cell wall biosynthesis
VLSVVETQPARRPMTTVALRRPPLLCISPLDRTGGVDTLLTAFGLLAGDRPRLRLDVVGQGPLHGMLHTLAVELGLDDRVRFCGQLPWHRVRAAMQRCAAVVLPHQDPVVLPHHGTTVLPHQDPAVLPHHDTAVLPHQDPTARAGGEFHLHLRSALELGRPLVATDRAAPPDVAVLMPGARVVPARDPILLASALADVIGPPERSAGWGRWAWSRAAG